MQDSLNEKIYAYTEFVIRWCWLVMAISIMASLALMYGAQNLAFDNDYRSFFSEENSHLKAFDEQQKTYTKNDNILFTITPDSGEVFTPEVLSAVEEVTAAAWQLPFALRVDSISNFQYSHAQDDDLIVEDLIEDALNYTPEQLLEKKRIALAAPFIVGQLLNPQASVTAVNITFQMPELSPDEAPQAVTAARELKEKI